MPLDSTTLPASIQERFADRGNAVSSRFAESASFREICFDFDEVVQSLDRLGPTDQLAEELERLAVDLEEEILSELGSGAGD
jgi:hypothetical protein